MILGTVFVLVSILNPGYASAGEFNGTKPLVCAAMYSSECSAEAQECLGGAPWLINFPAFVEVDFKFKTLSTTHHHSVERVSDIDAINHLPGGLMSVQGVDGDYAWSVLVSETTGSMTLSVSGEDVGFVVFGACTVR